MSRLRGHPASVPSPGPPYVGALLRLCWQRVRVRLNQAVRDAGFTDLQEAHLAVFTYPPPDGVRPADLARRMGMTRQAANHVFAQMEALGYLRRAEPAGGGRRLVYLTPRGRAVCEVMWATLRGIEAEWAEEAGGADFAVFMRVLRRLAADQLPRAAS
jgi:DNA-binding MarR family transcriptional regulator